MSFIYIQLNVLYIYPMKIFGTVLTGATSRAGTAHLSGEPAFTPGLSEARVARSLVFCEVFCRLWFVLWILITPLVSFNCSR